MRTTLFRQVGITELTMDLLLGCNNSDFRKEYGMTITLALGVAILSSMRAHHIIVLITGRQLLQKSYSEIILTGEILLSFRQRIQGNVRYMNANKTEVDHKLISPDDV